MAAMRCFMCSVGHGGIPTECINVYGLLYGEMRRRPHFPDRLY